MGTSDRKRIADALYMLAAGSNHATVLETMRRYVVVHSKSADDVLALLSELRMANPVAFRDSLQKLQTTQQAADIERLAAEVQATTKLLQRHAGRNAVKKRTSKQRKQASAGNRNDGSRASSRH